MSSTKNFPEIPSDYDYDRGVRQLDRIQLGGMFLWVMMISAFVFRHLFSPKEVFWMSFIFSGCCCFVYDSYFGSHEVNKLHASQRYILDEVERHREEDLSSDEENNSLAEPQRGYYSDPEEWNNQEFEDDVGWERNSCTGRLARC